MKRVWLVLVVIFMANCAHNQPIVNQFPSLIPDVPDWEQLLPPTISDDVIKDPNVNSYDDRPVLKGIYCKNQDCLPTGILVSENNFAQIVADQSTLKRVKLELELVKFLRVYELNQIKRGELFYQNEIVKLQNEIRLSQQPKIWDQIKPYAAFLLGTTMAILTFYSVDRIK